MNKVGKIVMKITVLKIWNIPVFIELRKIGSIFPLPETEVNAYLLIINTEIKEAAPNNSSNIPNSETGFFILLIKNEIRKLPREIPKRKAIKIMLKA